jgi:hypothetical protein
VADTVEIFLALRNARKFIEDATKSSKAVGEIGTSAEKSGKKASAGWKGVAKWAGGAAAIYGATRYMKGAVHSTEDLAKQTLRLSRVTGMSIESSSEWAQVLKARGMSTSTVEVAMVKLSREMDKTRKANVKQTTSLASLNAQYKAVQAQGGKKAPAALALLSKAMARATTAGAKARQTFGDLHVSARAIASGNTSAVFNQVAQAMSRMHNPARRLALAQQLFGRGARTLLPLLLKGRQGLQDQLNVVRKYGAQLGVHTVEDLQEMISHQREMRIASEGMKVQLTTALLPVMMQFEAAIVAIVRVMQPFISQGWVVKALLGALVVAFVAYKAAIVTTTIMQLGLTAATFAWIGVIALVVLALVAIGVGFVLLYRRVGWFRAAVDAMWKAVQIGAHATWAAIKFGYDWIKSNWPLLLGILTGPFGLATVLIIRHFGKIKAYASGVFDSIRAAITNFVAFVRSIPNMIGNTLDKIPGLGAAVKVAGGASHFVGKHFATGGRMSYAGNALVGERGPELLTLPGGARVTPLPPPPSFEHFGEQGVVEIVVPLSLDNRIVAQAVARYSADKKARR